MTQKNKEVIITHGTKANSLAVDAEALRWFALVYDSSTEYLSVSISCNGAKNDKIKIKFKKVKR